MSVVGRVESVWRYPVKSPNPEIPRKVARGHDGTAGVYGAVLTEGLIRKGDPVELLD